jgi:hypothetical protein
MPDPIRKRPPFSAPWPPPNFKSKRYVGLDTSFAKLGLDYNRPPMEIIQFNFRTRDPHEINWYLYEYLGCRRVTDDGKNYRFSVVDTRTNPYGMESPIAIYIPPDAWKPPSPATPTDEALRRSVRDVVASSPANNIRVSLGAIQLRSGDLMSVANAISAGRIEVRFFHHQFGWYDPKSNVLRLPWGALLNETQRGLCVHECIHAAMDLRRISTSTPQSETLAYLGQLIYMIRCGVTSLQMSGFFEDVAWHVFFQKAMKLHTGQSLAAPEVAQLYALIPALNPIYRNWPAPTNDG